MIPRVCHEAGCWICTPPSKLRTRGAYKSRRHLLDFSGPMNFDQLLYSLWQDIHLSLPIVFYGSSDGEATRQIAQWLLEASPEEANDALTFVPANYSGPSLPGRILTLDLSRGTDAGFLRFNGADALILPGENTSPELVAEWGEPGCLNAGFLVLDARAPRLGETIAKAQEIGFPGIRLWAGTDELLEIPSVM